MTYPNSFKWIINRIGDKVKSHGLIALGHSRNPQEQPFWTFLPWSVVWKATEISSKTIRVTFPVFVPILNWIEKDTENQPPLRAPGAEKQKWKTGDRSEVVQNSGAQNRSYHCLLRLVAQLPPPRKHLSLSLSTQSVIQKLLSDKRQNSKTQGIKPHLSKNPVHFPRSHKVKK